MVEIKVFLFVCALVFDKCIVIGYGHFASEEQIHLLFEGYNPKVPPTINGEAVLDEIQLYIISIDTIDDSNMEYSMSFYFRQRWTDARLTYNISGIDFFEIDTKLMNDVWVPDVYIINEREARFHDVTVPNKLIHIYPKGQIFYSTRISGVFSCDMNLFKYPLDRQICDIRFESYAYSAHTLIIRWQNVPMKVAPGLNIAQFNLEKHSSFLCDGVYFGVNYTCTGLKLLFERKRGYYIIQIYIPSILISIISCVNFWLDIEAVPARISLGLLTVLTMTTQSSSAIVRTQRISYVKALDVWLAACLFFVFAALIEFAYVNVTSRVEQRRMQSVVSVASFNQFLSANKNAVKELCREKERGIGTSALQIHEKARKIDRISRVVFPSLFVLFNIGYWTVYLVWEPVADI